MQKNEIQYTGHEIVDFDF